MARPAMLLMWPRSSDCGPDRIKRTKTKFNAAKPASLPVLFGASIRVLLDARNCIEDGPGRLGSSSGCLSRTEILDVDVCAEPGVIGQVPAVVVGIFVNDNGIPVPIPIANVAVVVGGDVEEEAAEPEALAISAAQMVDMTAAKAAGKAAVLPRMVNVIVGIIATGVVTDPLVVVMDVRSFRMTGAIAEGAMIILWVALRRAVFGRAIC